jgi:hypothetical protein
LCVAGTEHLHQRVLKQLDQSITVRPRCEWRRREPLGRERFCLQPPPQRHIDVYGRTPDEKEVGDAGRGGRSLHYPMEGLACDGRHVVGRENTEVAADDLRHRLSSRYGILHNLFKLLLRKLLLRKLLLLFCKNPRNCTKKLPTLSGECSHAYQGCVARPRLATCQLVGALLSEPLGLHA